MISDVKTGLGWSIVVNDSGGVSVDVAFFNREDAFKFANEIAAKLNEMRQGVVPEP